MQCEILFIVELLQHATKAVKLGRIFVARMYVAATKVQQNGSPFILDSLKTFSLTCYGGTC